MAQNIFLANNPYLEKIMRRVVPIVSIILSIFAFIGINGVISSTQGDLYLAHEDGVSRIERAIYAQLDEYGASAITLASDTNLRNYLTNSQDIAGLRARQLVADTVEEHANEYLAIRYLSRGGTIQLETINNNGVAQRTPLNELNQLKFSPQAETPIFDEIISGSITDFAVSDFRLRRDSTGQILPQIVFDVYAPVILPVNANVFGVIQIEILAAEILKPINLATSDITQMVPPQAGRHVILRDANGRIIADSAAIGDDYIRNLEITGGNATFNDIYVGLNSYISDVQDDERLASFDLTSNQLYSVKRIDDYNTNWQIVIIDNPITYYAATVWRIFLVVIVTVLTAIVSVFVLRRLLAPLLLPVAEADVMLQGTLDASISRSMLRRPAVSGDSELVGSVQSLATRLRDLDEELERQIERRNRDLQVAGRIGREAAVQSDLGELARRSINLICNELGFYHAQVFLLDDTKTNAVLRYSRGDAGAKLLERGHSLRVGSDTVIGTVTGELHPVIVNDTFNAEGGSPHGFNPLLPETRAEMGLPLIVGDEVLGALDIQSRTTDVFDLEDAPTYQLLADQLAVAIYNGLLREQSQRRFEQINRLNRQLTRDAWQQVEESLNLDGQYGADIHGRIKAPISIRGQVIGELEADLPEDQEFSQGDQIILQSVAERVALAIENARLFQETQSSLSETSTLYQLSRQLNEANTLEDVLQAIIVTVAPDAAGGQVWLFDETLPGENPEWVRLSVDLAILPRRNGQVILGERLHMSNFPFFARLSPIDATLVADTQDLQAENGALYKLLRSLNAQAIVFIPINMRGVWKGFMSVEFDEPHKFSEREERIYRALIAQAGVAIDNRLLLQQTEDALARQEKLYSASRIINTSQSLADLVYAAVATTSNPNLDFWLSLLESDEDTDESWGQQARIVAKSEKHNVTEVDELHQVFLPENTSMRQREPEVLVDPGDDIDDVPTPIKWIRELGYRFMAIFPLFSDNTPIALFYIVSRDDYQLSSDEYEVYKALTGQMSTQIQNRRLLQRTESALTETTRLYVATRAITGAQDSRSIYETVAGHLALPFMRQANREIRMSITILLAKPTPTVNAAHLYYEYQWLSDPTLMPDMPVGRLISQEDAPFGQMVSQNDDNMLVFRNIEADTTDDFPMIRDILSQNSAVSAVAAPLWSRQRWFGVMILRTDTPSLLTEGYLRFMQSISDQVAVAIENQRLLEENVSERERLNTILSTLPTGVLVLDPETFEPMTHNERLEELLGRAPEYGVPFQSATYNMYRTGTNLFYPDQELAIYQARERGMQMLGDDIAVIHDGGQTDLLVTAAPIYNPDGSQHLLVAAFQDISTLRSMENTMQENLRETVMLYETQRALTEAKTLDELLDNIIGQLAAQQPTDAYIIIAAEDEMGETVQLSRSLVQPIDNVHYLMPILHAGGAYTIDEVADLPDDADDARKLLLDMDIHSVLILPLKSRTRERPLGWLMLIADEPEAFTDDQVRTLGSVTDMASTAVDNSYLVVSTQSALRETADLYDATTAISRARDIYGLFDVIQNALQTLNPHMSAAFMMSGRTPVEYFNEGFEASIANGLDFNALMQMPLPDADGFFVSDITRATLGDFEMAMLGADNIQAFAVVNLRVKDVPRGRLFIAYQEPHSFVEGERRFLRALADSASVVIDNQQLLEQIQTTLQETTVLYQASKALLETNEPDDIIRVIVNHLIEPHINQVFIALLNVPSWDTSGAAVEVVASWQSDSDIDLLGVTLSPDQFPAWAQLSTDQTVLAINDIYDPQYELDMLEQTSIESLDTRSLVVIPLRVPSRAIGAIWLGSREPHNYTDADMRVYQTFAEQTSLSLEAQRLLEQTEQRARQLQTSSVISQNVSQILDLDELLPLVVDLIREQFGYDHVQVFLMDEDDEWALLQASTGEAGEKLLSIGHKLARGSESVIGQVTERGVPTVALDTADANVVHQPNPHLPLTRSELALPLTIQGIVVGALDVQSNQPNAFTDEDIQALSALANQIAVAIENARLYEEAERSATDMSFLFEITTTAAAADTLDEALKHVAFSIHDSLQTHTVAIYLPQQYEDYQGNQKILLEIDAISTAGDVEIETIESAEVGNAENMIGMVASTLQSQVVGNIEREIRYHSIHEGARSAALVPISSGANLIGLILLESTRLNAFDHETLTLLQTLAGSLSAIVQNSQLLEQLTATNERLREVDRLKSQFLASMSHELRTPLNSIIGFSRVMLKGIDGPLTEMQEQDLTTIYSSGNHLLNLINDILDQAKIEADELNLKFSYFDTKPMIESVRSIAIGMLKEKAIDLFVEIAPNMPQAYGDEFRSRQILLNLVSNAIKFTVDGSVTIRAYAAEGNEGETLVRIDVVDTGIGISEDDMPILFEQFRQIDSSLTRTVGGTGLGLPISKALTELQGGEMMVSSETNVGSTFSVTIPTEPGADEELEREREEKRRQDRPVNPITDSASGLIRRADVEKARKLAEQQGNGEQKTDTEPQKPKAPFPRGVAKKVLNEQRLVLLIEDNKDMVDQFRRSLQREGFEVQTAEHPAYAEAMVGQLRPNLVLLDVNFADGKGWNLLENLKERDDTFDIPIIVTTIDEDSERAYRLGAHTYIQRPFVPDDLLQAVLDAEKESRRERILIIDDQPDAIRLLTQLLDEHGDFRVFSAQSGDEGISLVARRRPDLIILDLRMPGKDGFAVLDELRGNPETAKIPVLVVTGDLELSTSEQEALQNIIIVPKTDISQEDYEKFIDNVKSYLESDGNS